ncbi:MAG: glycoside hydrolase 43 family protein, partial [Elusimicrobiaceae bacterium]|nr:glycoside hydrolase 43 family protein [Elusimicrobiaceae bacterium]
MNEPKLWCPDLGNGTFQNPILYADYSDPDVCRVGDTFYMTASSFNYIPGLPILVSKDLINWELKNYAIKERIPYAQYDSPAHAKGIWAPSIRYHNGEFYIFVGMPDEGIFMLKTKDPLGEWSEPCLVLPGKGYIDPCPLWDDDGTAYVIHGYAKSRIGFKSILGIFQITPDGEHAISDDVFLYDGTKTNPTIEGPKVYKRNGYYYIFAPAGGVKT